MVKPGAKAKINAETDVVLEYLKRTNRPYSVNDLMANLRSSSKAQMVKSLTELVETETVKQKQYGKQTIYLFNQDEIVVDENEMGEIVAEIDQLSKQVPTLRQQVSELQAQYSALVSQLTMEAMTEKYQQLTSKIASNKSKLEKLADAQANSGALLTRDEIQELNQRVERMKKEWRQRKKLFKEIIGAMLEGSDSSPAALIEELGLEVVDEHAPDQFDHQLFLQP